MSETIYIQDCKDSIISSADGPNPQTLFEKGNTKLIVAGLKAGQSIPPHEESLGIYNFLEGKGVMTVDDTLYDVRKGSTVVVPTGSVRGISAETDLSFMGTRITPCHEDGDCQCE